MLPREDAAKQIVASPLTSSRANWARCLTLLILAAAGTIIRLLYLVRKPFWFDETFSVALARMRWGSLLRVLVWREANMSLYYFALRIWLHLAPHGQNEFFIRSLSVVFAAATIPAMYWLASLLYQNDRRVALIAATLLTFNAYQVRYAQEARAYALFLLLATLSSGFFIAYLRDPSRAHRLGYILVSILAVYAHFYALLLLLAHALAQRWMAGADSGDRLLPATRSKEMRRIWMTIGIAVLPLLVFVAKTGAGPIRWIQRPDLHDLLAFAEHFAGGGSWPLTVIFMVACIVALVPNASRLRARAESWDVWRAQFLLLWLLFPIALTILLSIIRPVFLPRYLIFCLPPLLILVAAGLARLRNSLLLAAALTAVLLLAAQGIFFVYDHDVDTERDAAGAATNFILDHAQPGDAIVFHKPHARVPYEFFFSQRTNETSLGPEIVFPHYAESLSYRDLKGRLSADILRTSAPGHPRVWVMLMFNGPGLDPANVMLSQVLPESFPKMQRWQFPQVEVRLYSRQ
jgi:mannosyltransferase